MIKLNKTIYLTIHEGAELVGMKYSLFYIVIKKFNTIDFEGRTYIPMKEVTVFKKWREAKNELNDLKDE